jgi:hypothetical protein
MQQAGEFRQDNSRIGVIHELPLHISVTKGGEKHTTPKESFQLSRWIVGERHLPAKIGSATSASPTYNWRTRGGGEPIDEGTANEGLDED